MHADVADISFFTLSAVNPKYCLRAVDLVTSKIYIYLMKSRLLLKRKMKLFYKDLEPKRKNFDNSLRIQTDQTQNEIKKIK